MFDSSKDTEKGTLYYRIKEEKVTITSYSGRDNELILPEEIDGFPVRKISKKAFLNSRQMVKIVLPDTIRKVSDWAFAHSSNLETIEFPRKNISFGKGVFLGDARLVRIMLRDRNGSEAFVSTLSDKEKDDMAVLLAAAAGMKNADYLLDLKAAGSHEWYRMLDRVITDILDEDDEEGHMEMILCGEEDIDCTIEAYVAARRKDKARWAFHRLIHDTGLSDGLREKLKNYITDHTVGSDSEEAWEVLLTEKSHITEYYKLFYDIGGINDSNYDDVILAAGDKAPEMKAYFMREHKDNSGDYFASFEI